MVTIAVSFGELDVSPATIAALVGISLFTFVAVGLSSIKLIQSLLNNSDKS